MGEWARQAGGALLPILPPLPAWPLLLSSLCLLQDVEANIQKLVKQYNGSKISSHVKDHVKVRRGAPAPASQPKGACEQWCHHRAAPASGAWAEAGHCGSHGYCCAAARHCSVEPMLELHAAPGGAHHAGAGGGAGRQVHQRQRPAQLALPDLRAHSAHFSEQVSA